jgi:cytochrome c peroxidase
VTRAPVLLWLAVAGCGAASASPQGAGADKDRAAHGAMRMDRQLEIVAGLVGAVDPKQVPAGVDPVIWAASIPTDNAPTAERIALGKKLYFDPRLSLDGTVACATCHDVTRGFTDQRPLSEGIGGKLGRRNAPTTLNATLLHSQFWDGRAATLEEQARLPIINPIEMGMPDGDAAIAAIKGDPEYQRLFQAAYGRPPNFDDLGRAIAAFERTLVFLESPVDRFLRGDEAALSPEARRGWALYNGKARCNGCHPLSVVNPLGTDDRFHNVGVSARHQKFGELATQALALLEKDDSVQAIDELALQTDLSELGRFLVTKRTVDVGGFRTPQVRNVGITAPYMHDGSMQTLWDVMDHYNKGGEPNPFLDGGIEPLGLTEQEIDDVVAFMFALTDERFAVENQAAMAAQKQRAGTQRPFRDDEVASRRKVTFTPTQVK